MKAAEALIAWNGADSVLNKHWPPGSMAIGPLQQPGEPDWTAPYRCTGGAAYVERRKLHGPAQQHQVMLDWYQLVYSYGLHPYVVHRAFLLINEYQATIKAMGCGPAKGEPGHDPRVCFGRSIEYRVPELKIFQTGRATHFLPGSAPPHMHTHAHPLGGCACVQCSVQPFPCAHTPFALVQDVCVQ